MIVALKKNTNTEFKNTLNVESYMMSFNQSECINNKVVFKLRNSFERVAAKMDKCSINKKLSDQF